MRNLTARFTKTAPVLATALLCTAAFAQDKVAIPQPSTTTPQVKGGSTTPGGIAGAVLYSHTVETGFRYNPQPSTNGPQLLRTFDDIPIPLADLGGKTTIDVTKVTFGIRRLANAEAVTITSYWATATTEVTAPDTELDVPPTLIGSVSLPANGTASVTQQVSFGDGTATLFTVDLNDTVITGGGGPFGTFMLGIEINPPTPAGGTPASLNGWRLTTGPSANADVFWQHDPNNDAENAFVFGGTPPPVASFFVIVEGAPKAGDPCQEPLPFCNADVAPPGGNGTVNVDDLLGVINTWGNVGPPRPQGDCAPLPNGNCVVNTDDLLAVINNWGVCDTPSGACCLDNGTCLDGQTTAQCDAAGGTYQGDGTNCGSVSCPVLPLNDECEDSIEVEVGVNNVSNLNATTSQGIAGGACAFQGAQNFTRDVWFHFNATSGGFLTVDTCGTTGAVTDTVISIFSGTCASLNELACDDDTCAAPSPELLSSASATLPGPGTYLIRVGSWANGPTGPLALNVQFTAADNNECLFATNLPSLPANVTGTLDGAGPDADTSPGCVFVSPGFGRWYTVTGNGNVLTASTCVPTPFPTWNAYLHVYCGNNCNSLFCVNGNDSPESNDCSFFQETVSWCSVPGQTYWILVSNPDGPTGNYTLNVTSGAACGNPLPCGLANDECSGAFAVVNGANNIDGTGATTSPNIPGGLCTGAAANFTNDSWYKYVPTQSGFTEFKLCDSVPSQDDVLAVLDGTCAALVELACDDDGCVAGTFAIPSILVASVTTGNEVFVRVGTWNNTFPGTTRVLTITPGIGGCPGCQPGSNLENLPCRVNGDVANTDPNGGCNSTGLAPAPGEPWPTFSGPVSVGEEWCGIISNYTNSAGGASRDTDWYEFTPKVDGDYTITACSTDLLHIGFVENGTDVTLCAGTSAFVGGSGSFVPPNTVGTITRTLVAGNTYAVFMAPQTATSGVVCPPAGQTNYHFTVTGP